ncbi:MAG: cation transporter [Candidatus Lokiarchaeota archaeon]|nr:cation transporter [Candidatus Lokiarchaeota archaeon]
MKISKKPSDHIFNYRELEKNRLLLSLIITIIVLIIEILGSILSNSIALLSDAGHMFTHAFAISTGLFAIFLARKPLCSHKTFGLYRAEILAAFINGIFLLVIVGFIIYEAILRILYPVNIDSLFMIITALIGLFVNIASILILHGSHKEDLNIKGVFYHMIGDAISSIGVVFASIIIYFTDYLYIDPFLSFLISFLIIIWAIKILKESGRILLEMTPKDININMIEQDLKNKFKPIINVNHTHLWTITSEIFILTTHIQIRDISNQDELIDNISNYLHKKYNIRESTIQITYSSEIKVCKI